MAKYKLLLPKMGESVAEATIIRWTKNPGDYIEADETVMEIATDKVDSDVPSPVGGHLLEQLFKDNDVVQVGAAIAIIETAEPEETIIEENTPPVYQAEEEVPPAVPADSAFEESPQQPAYEFSAPAPVVPQEEALTSEVNDPGETKPQVFVEQRNDVPPPVPFLEHLEQLGTAKPADAQKNSFRFYSPLVKNIAAQEGISNDELDLVPGSGADGRLTKDDLLNYIQNRYHSAQPRQDNGAAAGEQQNDYLESSTASSVVSEPEAAIETPEPEPVVESGAPTTSADMPKPEIVTEAPKSGPVFEKPKAEAVAEKPKAEPAKSEPAAAAVPVSGTDEIIEMDRMRRLIADHMVMSKQTSPHVTSFVEADVTNLVLWRDKIKNSFEKREGEKITFTPIFMEAVVRAIKDMPMINIQVNGTQIIKKKDINISMATALPSGNLIVPVIKKADELNLVGLTKAVNDLAGRARSGKLKPDDVQGGTFTITNVGTFGNVMGTPIINQPQVAILAVGAIRKKPAVIETLQGDMIGIRHMMFLSLSYDHRVVDGALGGSFVKRVADYLENWDTGREI